MPYTVHKKNVCLLLRSRECSAKGFEYEVTPTRKVKNFLDLVICKHKTYRKIYFWLDVHMELYLTVEEIQNIYRKLYCMYTWTFDYIFTDAAHAKEGCFHEYSILWHLYRLVDETSTSQHKVSILMPAFHD